MSQTATDMVEAGWTTNEIGDCVLSLKQEMQELQSLVRVLTNIVLTGEDNQ